MSERLPILTLSGSPHEIGMGHGKKMREPIKALIAAATAVHQDNNGCLKADKASLLNLCRRNIGFLKTFSPELMEEMQGIADGAGVTFDDILYLNSFLELEDIRAASLGSKMLSDRLWGCTTFNVTREAGSQGRAYIGQTFDIEKAYEKFLVLLRIQPEKGPEIMALSFAGMLGLVGLNGAGVCAVINKIVATDARPGVIYPVIMRKILMSERIGDALGTVAYTRRASGLNYQLAGSGIAFCVETSATGYQLLEIDGAIAHTNHYIGSLMRKFETPGWLSHGGSMVRLQVAGEFLKRHRGRLDMDRLKELTKDHTNHPRCICAHGFPGEGETTAFHTVFGLVMAPETRRMEVCKGNPCENPYESHQL